MAKRRKTIETMLTDPEVPLPMKRELLQQLLATDEKAAQEILARWFEKATAAAADEQALAKAQEPPS